MAKQLSITGFIQGKGRDSGCLGGSGDKDASAKAKKRDGDKVYDRTVRKRVWREREAWKVDYPWLSYDEAKGLMYCTTCRANTHKRADMTSAYVTGAVCMQTSSINKHGESKGHCREQEAIEASKRLTEGEKEQRPAHIMLAKFTEKQRNQLSMKFRSTHALAKHHRPFSDYVWLTNLDRIKGLDVGQQYETDKNAAIFANHIAKVEREKVRKRVEDAHFVSLIMDGSTDVSVIEQEMVYVRSCQAGVVSVDFLQIVATPKADADGITASLEKAVNRGLSIAFTDLGKKLVAMGTDGAAVMLGKNNGVTTKVRNRIAPSLIAVHCFAHRLELASKDVVKQHPRYAEFEQLLQDLFKFYKMSNLNRDNLKRSCRTSGVKQLVPTRVGGTRWVTHTLRALNNMWSIYPGLVLHLSQVKDFGQSATAKAKASGFHSKLTSKVMVEFGHFLWDIILVLSKLSLVLQRRDISIAEVSDQVEGVMTVLVKYGEEGTSPKLTKVRGRNELCGVALTDDERRNAIPLVETTGTICADLIDSLTARFEMSDPIIAATSLANKKTWPSKSDDAKALLAFGDGHIKVLIDHFSENLRQAEVDLDRVIPDWTMLKSMLYKRHADNLTTMTWPTINRQYGTVAPGFLKLVDLLLTIPATSAEAERGFSVLKLTKSEVRNRMQNDSLNNLLAIKLLSPTEEAFDPTPAVNDWMKAAQRRRVGHSQGTGGDTDTPSTSTAVAVADNDIDVINLDEPDETEGDGEAEAVDDDDDEFDVPRRNDR